MRIGSLYRRLLPALAFLIAACCLTPSGALARVTLINCGLRSPYRGSVPYVYGGTPITADGLAHGGFDCSGFVWRVYKISGLPGEFTAGRPRRCRGDSASGQGVNVSPLKGGWLGSEFAWGRRVLP